MWSAALQFMANVTGLSLLWAKLKNSPQEQVRAASAQDQDQKAKITSDVESGDVKKVADDIAT